MEDDKDVQALYELQTRAVNTSEAHSRVSQQERMRTTQRTRFGLTKTEIATMPDATAMYRSVGKAYFAAPKADILADLDAKIASADEDLAAFKQQKEVIEKKLAETETELRELVKHSPSLVRKIGAMSV